MFVHFRTALNRLEICEPNDLRRKYHNAERHSARKDTSASETFELNRLMQKLGESENTDASDMRLDMELLNRIIAEIDAKIAEIESEDGSEQKETKDESVEQEEKKVPWCIELMPKQGFPVWYCRKYAYALLDAFCENDNPDFKAIYGDCVAEIPISAISRGGLFLANLVTAIRRSPKDITKWIDKTKQFVMSEIGRVCEKSKLGLNDLELMRFFRDALFLVLSTSGCCLQKKQEYIWEEAHTYLNYFIAWQLTRMERTGEAFAYAKQGIAITDPCDRQKAFNAFGVCAIETQGCKQLAYDIFFSWIYQRCVGEIKPFLSEYDISPEDDAWRSEKEGLEKKAFMHAQFAYVCGIIADTYEREDARGQIFRNIAIDHINIACAIQPDADSYCTYGTLLSDGKRVDSSYADVLQRYQMFYSKTEEIENKLTAQRSICETMLDEMQAQLYAWSMNDHPTLDDWVTAAEQIDSYKNFLYKLNEYRKMQLTALDGLDENSIERENPWEAFMDLRKKIPQIDEKLGFELLLLKKICRTIMNLLQRCEYCDVNFQTRITEKDKGISIRRDKVKPIAYYTTLKNASHLFDVLYRDNRQFAPSVVKKNDEKKHNEGINCLTMMHAHYMNDPCEGMILSEIVSGTNPYANILFYRGDAERFRDDIFGKYYVFLKSFTEKEDDLLMWNRYASDREQGSRDSNGCFIQFSTDSFDIVNNAEKAVKNRNKLLDAEDDYALYRVVYIDQDGKISKGKNRGLSPYVNGCYNLLIQLIRDINNELAKPEYVEGQTGEKVTNWIREFVQSVLKEVIFLFKRDDYADEAEYRLIVTRRQGSLEGIRLIPGEPDLLCVNPYFQICIDRIMLGPNVEKGERWTTYFLYQLNCMWQRAHRFAGDKSEPEFRIDRSQIRYHT